MSDDREQRLDLLSSCSELALLETIYLEGCTDDIAWDGLAPKARAIEICRFFDGVDPQRWEQFRTRLDVIRAKREASDQAGEIYLPQIPSGPFRLTGLPDVKTQLFGRDDQLTLLDAAWNDPSPAIVGLIGEGGQGKTVLIQTWLKRFRRDLLRGATGGYVHSFYRQTSGTGGVSDEFLINALHKFGVREADADPVEQKAQRLADELRKHRALLILDGVEPLQNADDGTGAAGFADHGLRELLRELAQGFNGLCIVSSRRSLSDLALAKEEGNYLEEKILPVEVAEGTEILVEAGVELSATAVGLAERAGGHGLTLKILGRAIANFLAGDAKRLPELLPAPDPDSDSAEIEFETVLDAVDRRLEPAQRCLLRLVGLFEAPARLEIISVFREEASAIEGATEPIAGMTVEAWDEAVESAREIGLFWPAEETGEYEIDAHPRVRQFFGAKLKAETEESWRECHSRIFDRLCETTEHQPADLAGLQPLYQAVTHGCLAGRHQEARAKVYLDRIQRGNDHFSKHKLGAHGSNLGAVAAFFEEPWRRLSTNLSESDQAWLLNEAAYSLRALGRLTEALEPMRAGLEMWIEQEVWKSTAIIASNLSELEVTLGRLGEAVEDGRRAIDFADKSGDGFTREANRAEAADALHQHGERAEARALFEEAERMQAERQSSHPLLYSVPGFHYVDLLLADAERAAWQVATTGSRRRQEPPGADEQQRLPVVATACADKSSKASATADLSSIVSATADLSSIARSATEEAERRASQTIKIAERNNWLLGIALDHLSLARARLYAALLGKSETAEPAKPDPSEVEAALNGLREGRTLGRTPQRPAHRRDAPWSG